MVYIGLCLDVCYIIIYVQYNNMLLVSHDNQFYNVQRYLFNRICTWYIDLYLEPHLHLRHNVDYLAVRHWVHQLLFMLQLLPTGHTTLDSHWIRISSALYCCGHVDPMLCAQRELLALKKLWLLYRINPLCATVDFTTPYYCEFYIYRSQRVNLSFDILGERQ